MKILSLRVATWVLQLMFVCCIGLIVMHVALRAVPYVKNARSYQVVKKATAIERSIASSIPNIVPRKVAGKNTAPFVMIAAALLLAFGLKKGRVYVNNRLIRAQFQKQYEALKQEAHLSETSSSLSPLKERFEKMQADAQVSREDLLTLFADTKKQLDTMQKNVAFLSIDIVDAHSMKHDEEQLSVEHDFMEYKDLVNKRMKENGVLKTAWTSDGVMSCFPTPDAAVKAARILLKDITHFNEQVKLMQKAFKIRCGVNAGSVYYDETLPMEEMSDRVIDIAGHMQKKSPENNVSIPRALLEKLTNTYNFVPIQKIVDGYEVCIFDRRAVPRN